MARGTAGICRNLTQGQLTALLVVNAMAANAARGDRFATKFMVLAKKRQWEALAAMASLFANSGTTPSSRDFRYAVPRNRLILSLKICLALLALIATSGGTLLLSKFGSSQPVHLAGAPAAPQKKSFGSDHPEVATDLDSLAGWLRDTHRPPKAEPLMRRTLAVDEKSFGPDHPKVEADRDNLAGLLRTLAIPKPERRTGHKAPSDDDQELLREMAPSNAEIEATLEEISEPIRPR
jgi:hypothetical protein